MFPFFVPLELLLHLARMLTLSIRLLANMFADHLLVGLWITMVPFLVPTIFMGLGSVVAVVQAFVFTLLTMTYIGMALDEPH
jgi:F-type H+-transporting ATPase subunit a